MYIYVHAAFLLNFILKNISPKKLIKDGNWYYTQPTTRFLIGARATDWKTWSGWLSEIIIFNRYLNDVDRKSVEKYLAQKYGIKITQ